MSTAEPAPPPWRRSANPEHLARLQEGSVAWNRWRAARLDIRPELSNATLHLAQLRGVDLQAIDLSGAHLRHARIVGLDLQSANLDGADLAHASVHGTDLRDASLREASLRACHFGQGFGRDSEDLSRDPPGAMSNLVNDIRAEGGEWRVTNEGPSSGSYGLPDPFNVETVRPRPVSLQGAHLTQADLRGASFVDCDLYLTRLGQTKWGGTLVDAKLSSVVDLASVQHLGPSRLTRRALASVPRDVRPVFLKGCGFADWEIAAAGLHDDDLSQAQLTELTYEINRLKSIQPIQYYSVFISYSHGDLAFAKKLEHALDRYGIRCWRDEHQMLPGDDIYEQIDRGIKLWDKFLLCCSTHSLSSWWVDNEIDTVFDKERRLMKERGSKVFCLVPLDLDGYVHNDGFASGKKRQIASRVAADFRKWATDEDDFQRQVKRLIRALSLDDGGREPPPMSRL